MRTYCPYLWIFILLLNTTLVGITQENEKTHTQSVLEKVREQYENDLQKAQKKHLADSIMGKRWGKLNAKDDIRFQLVRVYVEKESYDKALSKLSGIVAQSPDPKARMRAFCTRATIYELGLNQLKDALKEYRKAIQVPNNQYVGITAGAYLAMSEIYLQLEDRQRAKLILEESYHSLSYTHVSQVPIAKELAEMEL